MIQTFNVPIPLWLDSAYLNRGVRYPISLNLETHPHMLVVGATGSGKTYFLTLLLAKICKYLPIANITICDYKKSGFSQFADCGSFYGHEDVTLGIKKAYDEFTKRLAANDPTINSRPYILLLDEYSAYLSSRDKKQAEEVKSSIGNMLLMGRTLGFRIIIGIQRADAEHFKSGTRDQFTSTLALGNISKEQKSMLFTDYRGEMTEICGRGEGYLLLDGQGIKKVTVPVVKNFDLLGVTICSTMNRNRLSPPTPAGEA